MKIIIVDDFNLHVEAENDSLNAAFMLLDPIKFTNNVNELNCYFNHKLDLD